VPFLKKLLRKQARDDSESVGETYEDIFRKLPPGTKLTKENKEKIYRLFPVPSDFVVRWASVVFGTRPSGIVITDKALIIRASFDGVKIANKLQTKERKGESKASKKKTKKLSAIYQIILWEHFDADDFSVAEEKNGTYTIEYASTKYPNFSHECLANEFVRAAASLNRERKLAYEAAIAASSLNVLGFDYIVFSAMYGADTTKTGHGIYAEEASAILDMLNREKVQVVGRDNAKSGPDKIVDGYTVQCKYCATASSSVGNCFDRKSGKFRYYDMSGNPMMVEVPKDQYDNAVALMKKRILDGKVSGVADPNSAYDIIRKGKLTHKQALNLAKAGTIESLTYDAATGTVNCSFAFGLSALVAFAFMWFKTKDLKQSAQQAAIAGLQTFGLALGTQVLSAQIARTGLQKTLIPLSDLVVQKLGSKATQNLVNAMRKLAGKKPIYGAAAQKSLAKALRANVITQGIAFVVLSIPDTVKLVGQKMSGMEYAKNITSLGASMLGSGLGGLGATAVAAKYAGKVNNNVVKVVVFVFAASVGVFAGAATRKGMTALREDDAVILNRIFDAALQNTCIEYMLCGDKEIEDFFGHLFKVKDSKKALKRTMKNLYASNRQYQELQAIMEIAAMKVSTARPVLTVAQEPDEDTFIEALTEVINNSDYEEEDVQ